eukprot:TRINITY_DN70615_c0_g1_i1.p1 TRINITY_DN70615_c0_g1~~TRINITY_DN70615_c0_g1_i1.p1  ORF type:complete len:427 (+),score=109.85 TRINITY_DN70615_c0_g1_i1:75-1283(+)
MWWLFAAAAAAGLLWRLAVALPRASDSWRAPKRKTRLLVVLGSGGHTSEMFYDLRTIQDWAESWEAYYLVAATDAKSQAPADAFERERGAAGARLLRVPRAREVGQPYLSSVPSTLRAAAGSLRAVCAVMPDAVVCNGPGTCVPVVACAYLLRIAGWKRVAVIYSESLACVDHLSLSGRLLRPFADRFTVQWDPIHAKCKAGRGAVLHAGRCKGGVELPPLTLGQQAGDGSAIVTVGSTHFDALIESCDSLDFLAALRSLGVSRLKVQRGAGAYQPSRITGPDAGATGVAVEVIQYSPELPAEMRRASIVISHAGAGSVLDCLIHCRRMVVVPNEGLMANHQVQLAEELRRYGLLRWCRCKDLTETLRGYTGAELRQFPPQPTPVFADALRSLCGRSGPPQD